MWGGAPPGGGGRADSPGLGFQILNSCLSSSLLVHTSPICHGQIHVKQQQRLSPGPESEGKTHRPCREKASSSLQMGQVGRKAREPAELHHCRPGAEWRKLALSFMCLFVKQSLSV